MIESEYDFIYSTNPYVKSLINKNIFITGTTGTVGSYLLNFFIYTNLKYNTNITLICPVRNLANIDKNHKNNRKVIYFEYDITKEINYDGDVDYIIHCAAPTKSSYFVQNPVETIDAIVLGTKNLLSFFKSKKGKGFLYLSSIEIYGDNTDKSKIYYEDSLGALDTLSLRSCYPEGKRLAENLCVSYANEYNLSIKIARLAQILGQSKGDNRLIAYLCDSVKNNQTIILNSDGKAEKSFCYIMDCISALIYILVVGENTAYNVANNSMHMSVFELANFVSKKYLSKDVIVNNSNDCKYPKSSYLVLNSDKLMSLGWKPYVDIEEAFDRLLQKQE